MHRNPMSSICIVVVVLLIVPLVAWSVMLVWGRIAFAEAFSLRAKIVENPGLNDGFVPQGLTWNRNLEGAGEGCVLYTAGYMKDGSAARIYKVSSETGETTFTPLERSGKPFLGHTGGLQYDNGWFYLADEGSGLYFFPAEFPTQGEAMDIGEPIPVNNNSSFVFSTEGFVYVGEFNDGDKYVCHNDFSLNGTEHKAIVSKYNADNFSRPVAVYSICDRIQGFAILPDGTIVLSQSYGVSPSRFLVYERDAQFMTGEKMYGVEVCFLGEPSLVIKAPPMSEDLDIMDGNPIYMTESASKKYWFGNLYFDRYIYSLDVAQATELKRSGP